MLPPLPHDEAASPRDASARADARRSQASGTRRRFELIGVLTPKEPLPKSITTPLGFAGLGTIVVVWAALSYGGVYEPFFLPTPSAVAVTLYDLFADLGFAEDVWSSTYRIFLGFLLAAALAIPLGVGIGSYPAIQAFFEPAISAIRYMPASAFIPLLIIWLGIGDAQKVGVIFIGVFFPLTLLIADVSANVSKQMLNIAYTLGAGRWDVFRRVLVPASLPGIVDNLRIAIGWAWTYLIVAELVAASSGIGHVILRASRFLRTEEVIAGILTIGLLGIATDFAFRRLYDVLFPYAERVTR